MVEITQNELITLRDNRELVIGEVYYVTDYTDSNLKIYMTAISENTFDDESTSELAGLRIHFDLDNNKVDYMKDVDRQIEGYFDWTDNILGTNVTNIFLENAAGLTIKDSQYVYVENVVEAGSTCNESTNVVIGNGSTVAIESSSNITVGADCDVVISGCEDLTVGERCNLTLAGINGMEIGDDNKDLTLSGTNIIGSRNSSITVTGNSNEVVSDSIAVNIEGDCNVLDQVKYVDLEDDSSFNTVKKTSLTGLKTAVGNKVEVSHSVDVVNTNDNVVQTDSIIIQNRDPFLQYQTLGGVRAVKDLVQPVNMQADSQARTLIVDQAKFRGEAGVKDNKTYVIVDGVWKEITE